MRRVTIHVFKFSGRAVCLGLLLVLLPGCGKDPVAQQRAVDIRKDDVCAVCGMYIDGSPGPRGEAYVAGRKMPLKFDSTRDFFAYILQPENKLRLQSLFVQDSAQIDWDHPANSAATFIEARTAHYVVWQPRPGSMGPTMAPYASRADAEAFVRKHGGEVLGFDDITTELTSSLDYGCPARGTPTFHLTRQCLAKSPSADPFHIKTGQMPGMSGMQSDHLHAHADGG
jgi:copper chaperone NosL